MRRPLSIGNASAIFFAYTLVQYSLNLIKKAFFGSQVNVNRAVTKYIVKDLKPFNTVKAKEKGIHRNDEGFGPKCMEKATISTHYTSGNID